MTFFASKVVFHVHVPAINATMSEEEGNKIVKFNVGGIRYEVARSFLELHPNTMLARIVSEKWQEDPTAEIFIERDGSRFKYVLDYLRDGKVHIPFTLPKKSLADDMKYFAIAFEADLIVYSKGSLYAAANSIRKKKEMLDNEEKEAARRVEMLQFVKECFAMMVAAKLGESRKSSWNVIKAEKGGRQYRLWRSMQSVMNDPSEKDELLGICRRYGFVPTNFEVHAAFAKVYIDYVDDLED